ncbi:hypothetical protein K239x_34680 [Planctomycetes bacterium K23_9]|uniref:SbsA Ig-like domain-containing protein n=2 Tax=Stieleria marina TaxID=1930275 RepID=A0A517NWF8_9BACT|nr:hypothetical protein K239x_34680 [Planctomycetes bacterium K23_9]
MSIAPDRSHFSVVFGMPARFGWVIAMLLVPDVLLLSGTAESQDNDTSRTEFRLAAGFPSENATNVSTGVAISLRFNQPVNPDTLKSLKLIAADGTEVPCRRSTDLTNASITLVPRNDLKPLTKYTCQGSNGTMSQDGQALTVFSRQFTTGLNSATESAQPTFNLQTFDETRSMTTILFGPDRRLYAADAFGHLVRWDIDDQGFPQNRTVLLSDPNESRQYIDLEWDPDATADNLILWASFSHRKAQRDDRFYFTGTIVRMQLGDTIHETTIVSGLPHGRERQGGFDTLPHQPNGLVFRDGKLYQTVGSTSSSGGPPNWGNPEQPLSACILEYNYRAIDAPLDVHPSSGIDPSAKDSPVKIYATGVRNALEITSHSNGHLYTATNINDRTGPQDGVPNAPHLPGNQNLLIKGTTPDHESLFLLKRGRHYGFPNPSRGQYVLHGGNPTAQKDRYEIPDYPVGTQPDEGFAAELMYEIWQHGGTSANGMIEYQPATKHPLSGCLLSCFFSAKKISAIRLGDDGLPISITSLRSGQGKLTFDGPLDITQDKQTGILYIADFGTQSKFGADGSLKVLRPSR